jgi:hypothetical protein
MSYLELPPGMGSVVATVIASAIGPLAQAGADVYSTHEGSKIQKKELKQREAEFARLQDLARRQLLAQERQAILSRQTSLQQAKIWGYWATQNMPYVIGGVALVVLGLTASRTLGRSS